MSFSDRKRHRQAPVIELAPMIDVVFLLLLFFMVTTTFVSDSGLEIDLPQADAAPIAAQLEPLVIEIDKAGVFGIGGERYDAEQLGEALAARPQEDRELAIIIRADKGTDHGDVVTAMSAAKEQGYTKLGIATSAKPKAR